MNFHNVKFFTSFGRLDQLPPSNKIEIVFAGRSNVGKSSMINKVFNRKKLAKVSSTPGKTATINFFELENVYFADLPGYGYAKVGKSEKQRWSDLIEGYFASDRNIQLVFLLIDVRHAPSADDMTMINFLVDYEFPFVLILTKTDKLSKNQLAKRLEELKEELPQLENFTAVPFSSQTGQGVEEIKAIIEELAIADLMEEEEPENLPEEQPEVTP